MHQIVNAEPNLTDGAQKIFAENDCQVRFIALEGLTESEFCQTIVGVEGVLAGGEYYTPQVFEAADQLKIVARSGVGVDHVNLKAAAEHGVWVTNTPGATNTSVAEFSIGLMLSLLRHITTLAAQMKTGTFVRTGGRELAGLTLGVIGTGGIGQEVSRLARAFGTQVLGYDIHPDPDFAQAHQVEYVSLKQLLQQSDIVTIHCGLDESTRGMIGEAELQLMQPTAYLVNTARPQIVDKQALVNCLEAGNLAGAAIDVWETIPCPADDPLLQLDNVLATAWSAFYTDRAVSDMHRRAAQEIVRVLQGHSPEHPVNSPQIRES
jgi:phosphoglycerate dehydrogenase-like enzyme